MIAPAVEEGRRPLRAPPGNVGQSSRGLPSEAVDRPYRGATEEGAWGVEGATLEKADCVALPATEREWREPMATPERCRYCSSSAGSGTARRSKSVQPERFQLHSLTCAPSTFLTYE
jgi:hypothetical protein